MFEHLENPLEEIETMFKLSDNIIFSTVFTPDDIKEFDNWWYVSPLIGQHIAFYDFKTLQYLANRFGKNLYSNKVNLHFFSSKKIDSSIVNKIFEVNSKSLFQKIRTTIGNKFNPVKSKESLLPIDYLYIENKLTSKL